MAAFGISGYASASTALALTEVSALLAPEGGSAFVAGHGQGSIRAHHDAQARTLALDALPAASEPAEPVDAALGVRGLLAYGAGFGMLLAASRRAGKARKPAGRRGAVVREAGNIEVAEKTETKPTIAYLEKLPRTIMEQKMLDKLLAAAPKEQWDNPPEDSPLYMLKMYAETYGEGKVTKMGWWDFFYMREVLPSDQMLAVMKMEKEEDEAFYNACKTGKIPMQVPGLFGSLFDTGITYKFRGAEPFAGDQVQTVVGDSRFSKQFINNTAFYREGLEPWQRGLEIGMAHGYFLIGPFVSLGPLRNTPEAATVGLLCGVAIVGIVSVGGLLFGRTIKPTLFDKEGDAPAAGFQTLINWHALGGIGGAGFAHALITVFGS